MDNEAQAKFANSFWATHKDYDDETPLTEERQKLQDAYLQEILKFDRETELFHATVRRVIEP